jgi:hypothetical protein
MKDRFSWKGGTLVHGQGVTYWKASPLALAQKSLFSYSYNCCSALEYLGFSMKSGTKVGVCMLFSSSHSNLNVGERKPFMSIIETKFFKASPAIQSAWCFLMTWHGSYWLFIQLLCVSKFGFHLLMVWQNDVISLQYLISLKIAIAGG